MNELSDFVAIARADHQLCVLCTTRADGSVQSTVVNVGVVAHPLSGRDVVALVAEPGARKVANLRARPHATLLAKTGWNWATVEGTAEVVDHARPLELTAEQHRRLLRDVFAASIGGTPDDWQLHADNMDLAGHVVVLVTPSRMYSGTP